MTVGLKSDLKKRKTHLKATIKAIKNWRPTYSDKENEYRTVGVIRDYIIKYNPMEQRSS